MKFKICLIFLHTASHGHMVYAVWIHIYICRPVLIISMKISKKKNKTDKERTVCALHSFYCSEIGT